ncbi:MAG: KEOPS complex kinase/ATPase Bud32 [Candidatus Micrarchaeia archaeon]
MKLISEGAEAKIYVEDLFGERVVVKERVEKKYREKALDIKIRSARTKNEARVLYRALRACSNVPRLIGVGRFSIYMSFIDGKLLRDVRIKRSIIEEVGMLLARMHNADITHGDFTPANIMVSNGKAYVIDFGLASISKSIEEKAIDVLLMKRSLDQRRYKLFELSYMKHTKEGKKVLERVKEIEKRGRYQNRSLNTV